MIKKILVLAALFLPLTIAAAYNYADQGYLLFQLGDPTFIPGSGWVNHADTTQLLHWGKAKGLVLIDDAAPVANQKASFIAKSSVTIQIAGLEAHKTYSMWIDFVKFQFSKNPGIYSKLHIYADDREIDVLTWGNLPADGLYKIDLPLDITYKKSVTITFREYAMNYGYWGVWDIIVASGDLPDGSFFKTKGSATPPMSDHAATEKKVDELEKTKTAELTTTEKKVTIKKESPKKSKKSSTSVKKKSSTKKKRLIVEKKKKKKIKAKSSSTRKKTKKTTKKRTDRVKKKMSSVTEPTAPLVPDIDEPIVDKPKIPKKPLIR